MAGTINLALSQQFNMDGEPLSGGRLFTFQAATSTPQSTFQDEALTVINPNPLILDASGRIPMFYIADGHIKIRLEDKTGVVIIAADNILVTGGSGGAAPPPPIDTTAILGTGDIKARFGVGFLAGFVRCNGETIGNTGSGATELASTLLARSLFIFLWPNLTLSIQSASGAPTSRGINAADDFDVQSKRLALPDLRGRTIAGLDDMGVAAAGRLTSSYWGLVAGVPITPATVLGNAGGDEKNTLVTANLAQHLHKITNQLTDTLTPLAGASNADHAHPVSGTTTTPVNAAGTIPVSLAHTHPFNNPVSNRTGGPTGDVTSLNPSTIETGGVTAADPNVDTHLNHAHNFNVASGGISAVTGNPTGGHRHPLSGETDNAPVSAATPHASAPPSMVLTFYIKL